MAVNRSNGSSRKEFQNRENERRQPNTAQRKKVHKARHREVRSAKVVSYRRPLNLNIGFWIFFGITCYIVVMIVLSFGNTHISPYEVKEGTLATNYTYRGIALREEEIVKSSNAGYINYYAREGERVAKGDLIYTIDETGKLKDLLASSETGESRLSDKELNELRSDIVDFIHTFDSSDFSSVYSFKYSMKSTVMKLANASLMQNIDSLNGGSNLPSKINFLESTTTGVVSYWIDGLEQVAPSMINMEDFDEENYEKTQLLNTEIITADEPVYKIILSDEWNVVFPIEKSLGEELVEEEYIKVRFLKNQYESWAKVSMIKGSDDGDYLVLNFNNSMPTFSFDRFVDLELILHDNVGLKIPNSSITEKEFFLIPEEYTTEENGDSRAIMVERYNEDGQIYSDYVICNVYHYDKENKEYYIANTEVALGTNLIKPNGQEKFTISRRGSLTGVYCMNKGYAEFRKINVLYQNEEYSIVKPNVQYGLNVYDYIVLNAASVKEDQLLY